MAQYKPFPGYVLPPVPTPRPTMQGGQPMNIIPTAVPAEQGMTQGTSQPRPAAPPTLRSIFGGGSGRTMNPAMKSTLAALGASMASGPVWNRSTTPADAYAQQQTADLNKRRVDYEGERLDLSKQQFGAEQEAARAEKERRRQAAQAAAAHYEAMGVPKGIAVTILSDPERGIELAENYLGRRRETYIDEYGQTQLTDSLLTGGGSGGANAPTQTPPAETPPAEPAKTSVVQRRNSEIENLLLEKAAVPLNPKTRAQHEYLDERIANLKAENQKTVAAIGKADQSLRAVRDAQDIIASNQEEGILGGNSTLGIRGWINEQFPSTQATLLRGKLKTAKAIIGFDTLQAIRDASPTGGAVGQVSNYENALMQAVKGNLEQFENDEVTLMETLKILEAEYMAIRSGKNTVESTLAAAQKMMELGVITESEFMQEVELMNQLNPTGDPDFIPDFSTSKKAEGDSTELDDALNFADGL